MKSAKKKKLSNLLSVYLIVGILLWIMAAILIFTPALPQLYYTFFPQASVNELTSLTQNLTDDTKGFNESDTKYNEAEAEPVDDRPPLDESLPSGSYLRISSIGVDAPIQEGEDYKAALQEGPWIVNDFGVPDTHEAPIIIASHRWGGLGWNKAKRDAMSFLKLPDLKVGDTIEIVWEQRLYKYEVYQSTEDTKITDYDADLILYTCKMYWQSPLRIFMYAKRAN